jgi:hypothetical protein
MRTARRIAASVARTWVHLYTSRMPTELRVTRRAEIDSDLWDHAKDAREDGVPPLVTALEILLRTGLGILDDLSWCFEARQPGRGASRKGRRFMMAFSARQTRWMGILFVAGSAVAMLMLGVIPTLQSYFASAGIPLPLPTRTVIAMSAFVTAYWWACVAGIVALFLATKQLDKILPTMLAKVADFDDDEVDAAVEALLSKMEPIMIVGLGVVVGGMIVATYLPIWDVVHAVK